MFRGLDEMRREMEREFEGMEKRIPKDLVREYTTPGGGKVREVGPMVYGYSMTVGPDGKPKIREFGNVKPGGFGRPHLTINYTLDKYLGNLMRLLNRTLARLLKVI